VVTRRPFFNLYAPARRAECLNYVIDGSSIPPISPLVARRQVVTDKADFNTENADCSFVKSVHGEDESNDN
jgi:hypothetical protein